MIIDIGEGWSFNTEFFIEARPVKDEPERTLIVMTIPERNILTDTKNWALIIARIADLSLDEIKAEIAEANKPDGELVMHEVGKSKRKNGSTGDQS